MTTIPENSPYAEEVQERWGHTEAYRESQERVSKLSREDLARIHNEGDALLKKITENREKGADHPEIQTLIDQHYQGLRAFYEPSLELYRGLGQMYADDARFAAFYEQYSPGLAVFLRDAMILYCDTQEQK